MTQNDLLQPLVDDKALQELLKNDIFSDDNGKLEAKDIDFLNNVIKRHYASLKEKELRKLKDIIRIHVPSWYRVDLWTWVCGKDEELAEDVSYYQTSCEEVFSNNSISILGDQEVLSYYLTPNGGNTLCKISYMIKYINPDIVCWPPILEPVIAILLHFLPEEKVYACMMAMLKNESIAYFDQTRAENVTTDATLQDLLKHTNKHHFHRIESFLTQPGDGKKLVMFPFWQAMIFENLEFTTLVRLMDLFMVEGPKILYRVGLYILNAFYHYCTTFKQLHCSYPEDLVKTIGQHASSMSISQKELIKACCNINLTTKKIHAIKEENSHLFSKNKLEYNEEMVVNQVVAVDLKQVSDIILPSQWQDLCQWLPARIQVLQPVLLFSTNQHGYNLRTLYEMCENEEQTLMIIQTTTKEIFGAYMSSALYERHAGHNDTSYFGTGETFVFKLSPTVHCYHWHDNTVSNVPRRKKSKYVFFDTVKLDIKEEKNEGNVKEKSRRSRKKSIRKSFRRSLSFTKGSSRREPKKVVSAHPLTSVNVANHSVTVPKNLYLGNLRNTSFNTRGFDKEMFRIKKLKKVGEDGEKKNENEDKLDEKDCLEKKASLSRGVTFEVGYCRSLSKQGNVDDLDADIFIIDGNGQSSIQTFHKSDTQSSFDILDSDKDVSKTAPKASIDEESQSEEKILKSLAEMFISCDESRLVVGGGNGEAIHIDHELNRGRSCKCDTFLNTPLTSCENGDFTISRIDVFGFQ